MEDLRGWLEEVDKIGELKKIEGADWDLEIGCIAELNKGRDVPALLFDNIKGYPKGYRVVCSSVKTPARISLTLGLSPCHSDAELIQLLREKLREWRPKSLEFPPKTVHTGPILENVDSDGDLDLFKFPVPKWHEIDGGRYIGTGNVVITRDPDSGVVNLGTYRVMIHDRNTTGLFMEPGRHGLFHIRKYHERGQPAPVAVSVGHHPLIFGVGSDPMPEPEYNFVGAIRGEPFRVIKEEITGLPIPADGEIVIAGWCPPGKTRQEGPFGEFTGFSSGLKESLIIEVKRVYHRNDPILLGAPPGQPPTEIARWRANFRSALLINELTSIGIPDVKSAWIHEAAGGNALVIVSLKQRFAGHAKQVALMASQSRMTNYNGRYVVIIDDDLDPTNTDDVIWALGMRTDPEKDVDIIRRCYTGELDPIPRVRKPHSGWHTSKAIIDATIPYEVMDEFPPTVRPSAELVGKVKEKWGGILKLR